MSEHAKELAEEILPAETTAILEEYAGDYFDRLDDCDDDVDRRVEVQRVNLYNKISELFHID